MLRDGVGAQSNLKGFGKAQLDQRGLDMPHSSRHAELARELAPRTALLKMRTFVPRYLKSLDGARNLRRRLIQCTEWTELDDIINAIASGEPA